MREEMLSKSQLKLTFTRLIESAGNTEPCRQMRIDRGGLFLLPGGVHYCSWATFRMMRGAAIRFACPEV